MAVVQQALAVWRNVAQAYGYKSETRTPLAGRHILCRSPSGGGDVGIVTTGLHL